MWKEGESETVQNPQEQEQRQEDSDRRNGSTHCNTSKLNPSLNHRIPEVFTIVFLFLGLLCLDIDVGPGPGRNAHLASIGGFSTSVGR